MDLPAVTEERTQVGILVILLVGLIAFRLILANYGIDGPVFRASLALIYILMLLLIVFGFRHIWRSREVLQRHR